MRMTVANRSLSPNTAPSTSTLEGVDVGVGLATLVGDITARLDLRSSDRVLDFSCGNAMVTRELARRCQGIVGMDVSPTQLRAAQKNCSAVNVELQQSRFGSSPTRPGDDDPFTKVVCYQPLTYFESASCGALLDRILPLCSDESVVLFKNVPSRAYARGAIRELCRRSLRLIGSVVLKVALPREGQWTLDEIRESAEKRGLEVEVLPPTTGGEPTARGVLDVRFRRRARAA